jgi:hypothetical protein
LVGHWGRGSGVLFGATPARDGFDVLHLVSYVLIEGRVGQVDDALIAGVRVVVAVLVAVCARLSNIHSGSSFLCGPGPGRFQLRGATYLSDASNCTLSPCFCLYIV